MRHYRQTVAQESLLYNQDHFCRKRPLGGSGQGNGVKQRSDDNSHLNHFLVPQSLSLDRVELSIQ